MKFFVEISIFNEFLWFLKSKFLSIPETVTNFRQRLDLHEARIKNDEEKNFKILKFPF